MSIPRTLEDIATGANLPADNGRSSHSRPEWFDQEIFQRTREIYVENRASLFFAHLSGLILVFLYTPTVEPFLYTRKSNGSPAILRRYLSTAKRIRDWYDGDIWSQESNAHRSILAVRKMHKLVSGAIDSPTNGMKPKAGSFFFSQSAMAHTQFAFVGWIILYHKHIGLHCTREEFASLLHFWRCIGYLLGMEDRYNVCSGNYEECVDLFKQIVEKDIKKRLKKPREDGVAMSRDIATAFGGVAPMVSWQGLKRYWFEAMGVTVDFPLSTHDKVCYWFYRLLYGTLLKSRIVRWFVNELSDFAFNQLLRIYDV